MRRVRRQCEWGKGRSERHILGGGRGALVVRGRTEVRKREGVEWGRLQRQERERGKLEELSGRRDEMQRRKGKTGSEVRVRGERERSMGEEREGG